jgi:hypothetical protein
LPLKIGVNQMMRSLSASLLNQKGKLAFDFHLADNIQKIGDLNEFLINGIRLLPEEQITDITNKVS